MQIYNIIAGAVLLVFGGKLFWLVIGIAGFLFGMQITPLFFEDQPQWLQLAVAIGMGFAGAILAVLTQRVAFMVGGFLAGMYLALMAAQSLGVEETNTMLILVIGAGLIGAVIAMLVMDKAITMLACLVGAGAIVGEMHLGNTWNTFAFAILAGGGYVIQEILLPGAKKK